MILELVRTLANGGWVGWVEVAVGLRLLQCGNYALSGSQKWQKKSTRAHRQHPVQK